MYDDKPLPKIPKEKRIKKIEPKKDEDK